ncbi:hypothetical protein KP509_02G086400 [Ceratopteris richardii]|uniref:Uncharacterized protein n=1 Tax=Ceratopteris richardii TaxID=49495 RepID=A0A8T2VBS0_CERRI|nr:hypothetical protein KP509_02G086400 [Ceratopteris richardii]
MLLRTPPPHKRPRLPSPEPPPQQLAVQALPLGRFVASEDTEFHHDCDDRELLGDSLRCTYKCKQLVKAEFLERYNNQERKISDLTTQLESLESSSRAIGIERNNLLEQVERLQQEKAAATARERATQDKYEIDLNRFEERFRGQFKRCEELEVKLQQEVRLRAEAELHADNMISQAEDLKITLEKNAEKMKKRIETLEEQLRREQKDAQFAIVRTEAKTSQEKTRAQYAESEIEILRNRCEDLQQRLSKCMDENRALSDQLAAAPAESSSSRNKEMETVIKHLRDELKSFEKVESERLRAERAEAALEELVNCEVQTKSLIAELQIWKSLIDEIPDVEKRDDIPIKMRELQRELLASTAEVGKLTAKVSELHSELEKEKATRYRSQNDARISNKAVGDVEAENKRLKRQVELLKREVNGLKSILSSYDEEESLFMPQNSAENGQLFESRVKLKEERIQKLEVLIEDLQREGELLRSELASAELKLGRGDYDPAHTKVVHMVENLDVSAEKKVLLAEIQNLQEKLKALEDETFTSASRNAASKNAELSMLRDQVSSLEKREAR